MEIIMHSIYTVCTIFGCVLLAIASFYYYIMFAIAKKTNTIDNHKAVKKNGIVGLTFGSLGLFVLLITLNMATSIAI